MEDDAKGTELGERRTRRRLERISSFCAAILAIGAGSALLVSIILSTLTGVGT